MEPSVVPIHSMGVIDIDRINISTADIMAHVLTNSTKEFSSEDYFIRKGSAFVNMQEWTL